MSLSAQRADVEASLARLEKEAVIPRIWLKDHTVWSPDPEEIVNRLGWLDLPEQMKGQVPALTTFAREIREAGFQYVVVLGMGGASLGTEAFRQAFGRAVGFPQLVVLDSIVPAWVKSVTDSIAPAKTLFLVSSKSGTTLETRCLYQYFRGVVEAEVGRESAGRNFVAITDPGTVLEKLAHEAGFRRTFTNPPDVGGRYSVLSYFGLVAAALMGVDIKRLLECASAMRARCAADVPVREDQGTWLGATIGTLAMSGRDKLTVVTSPAIGSFGLWLEQLIAESTGKDGKGIVPIVGERLVDPKYYGRDRVFVYLRLKGDDNAETDRAVDGINSFGHPVVLLEMADLYDLGAEFFRWEFATAVAGAVLGLHPFNQPDVENTKRRMQSLLGEYVRLGRLPVAEGIQPSNLLSQAQPGDYFGLMTYVHPTSAVERAMTDLRSQVIKRKGLATTLGYGPRFLHSTGQLHKGGPNTGLFLQITMEHEKDLSILGEKYTFGMLADAEALGDFQALQSLGRRVSRLHLKSPEELQGLADRLM